jgi:hypothetical protein
LLETLIAAAILFMSLFALNQLLDGADQDARDVRDRSFGVQLTRSKMNEIVAGAVSFDGETGEFTEAPGWQYTIESTEYEAEGLWLVNVRVSRTDDTDLQNEMLLTQVILDPAKKGSAIDDAVVQGTDTPDGSATGAPSDVPAGGSSGGASGGSSGGASKGGASKGGSTGGGGGAKSGGSGGGRMSPGR